MNVVCIVCADDYISMEQSDDKRERGRGCVFRQLVLGGDWRSQGKLSPLKVFLTPGNCNKPQLEDTSINAGVRDDTGHVVQQDPVM